MRSERSATHLTVEQRVEMGREARSLVPRESHALWKPSSRRPDPIDLLEEQSRTRIQKLVPIRYGRMKASPSNFYRGGALIMASDLSTTPRSGILVQLCGDAHMGNFGGFASPEGELVFGINDFDETFPGPWEWDVKRLAASIEIEGRAIGLPPGERRSAVETIAGEYRHAMHELAGWSSLKVWYSRLDETETDRRWGWHLRPDKLTKSQLREAAVNFLDNTRAYEKHTHRVDGRIQLVSEPPQLERLEEALPSEESKFIEGKLQDFLEEYAQSLLSDRRRFIESYRVVDIARKVAGVGSVGTRTLVVLLLGRDENDPLFLQVKEAQSSVLEAYTRADPGPDPGPGPGPGSTGRRDYSNNGERVVNGQRLIQGLSDILLGSGRFSESDGVSRDYYIRQLWDWKVSVPLQRRTVRGLARHGRMCAWTLARSHARSGDAVAIAAYLGNSNAFDRAIAEFSVAYADQNQHDYKLLVKAIRRGRIKAQAGV